MPLHILRIQCWGFEPKDYIPTFPLFSLGMFLAHALGSGGCFANAFARLSNESDPDPRQLAGTGTPAQRHGTFNRNGGVKSRVGNA
jgi:hypothetical protein